MVHKTVKIPGKIRPIKSKMNSPHKIKVIKLFQFQNSVFLSFQWLLLIAAMVDI